MREIISHTTSEYTVIVLARTESGDKIKLCQIEMPKDSPGKFQATTHSFATLKGVTDLAGEMIEEAEKIYLRDLKNEKTNGG